jgi:hypothetical protein
MLAIAAVTKGDNCRILRSHEIPSESALISYTLSDEVVYAILKPSMVGKEDYIAYIFTDQAMITVMPGSTIGTKKVVSRFDYCDCKIDNVWLHTPGKSIQRKDSINVLMFLLF